MNNKRVSIYLGTKDSNIQNIEKVLTAYGKYLSDFDLETFGSSTLPNSASEYYTHINTREVSHNNPFSKIIAAHHQCQEYLSTRSTDLLIQLWNYGIHAPAVSFSGKRNSVPVVTRFTEDVFNQYQAYNGVRKMGAYLQLNCIGRVPLTFSDKIVVFGPHGFRELVGRGFQKEDIITLPPTGGVEDRFSPPKSVSRCKQELNLLDKSLTVLYVGRLIENKGMDFLDSVMKKTIGKRDVQFILVGEGDYKDYFIETYDRSDVRVEGYVDYSKIHKYHRSADLYIHPSPYEGLPLVILEALKCGTPVIAREAGDIPLVTEDIVDTSTEMAQKIIDGDYEYKWKNKNKFSDAYQENTLRKAVQETIRPSH
jgi:glycosyltransferase involved in cell wall biosynthesis